MSVAAVSWSDDEVRSPSSKTAPTTRSVSMRWVLTPGPSTPLVSAGKLRRSCAGLRVAGWRLHPGPLALHHRQAVHRPADLQLQQMLVCRFLKAYDFDQRLNRIRDTTVRRDVGVALRRNPVGMASHGQPAGCSCGWRCRGVDIRPAAALLKALWLSCRALLREGPAHRRLNFSNLPRERRSARWCLCAAAEEWRPDSLRPP